MIKNILLLLIIVFAYLSPNDSVLAKEGIFDDVKSHTIAEDPYTLISEVNELREATGKLPYEISPILMQTAQAQADYMASIGQITHLGPGGVTTTNRLLAAGYPLAGDLSLGGIRSENITGGAGMTAADAVNSWKGDDIHYNTMTSPNNTQIGAGIAVSGTDVYFVIDCARNIGAKTPYLTNTPAPTSEGGDNEQAAGADNSGYVVLPGEGPLASSLFTATPDNAGHQIHIVKSGETLWLIAISYGVKIADIRRLNNMLETDAIYPKEKLLIRTGVFVTPILPAASITPNVTPASLPTQTETPIPIAAEAAVESTPINSTILGSGIQLTAVIILIGIILLALIIKTKIGQND